MPRASCLAVVLGVLFALSGCGGGDACAPGETQACTCAGGSDGGQECAEDGQSWTDCDCGTGDDDDDAGSGCENAEPCTGNYYIESDVDFEAVALCESTTGGVSLNDEDWPTSVDLPCLESVGGSLTLSYNDSLISLSGLSNLESVDGTLFINRNVSLTRLTGLSSLEYVGGSLRIVCNTSLSQSDAEAFAASIDVIGDSMVSENGASGDCDEGDDDDSFR